MRDRPVRLREDDAAVVPVGSPQADCRPGEARRRADREPAERAYVRLRGLQPVAASVALGCGRTCPCRCAHGEYRVRNATALTEQSLESVGWRDSSTTIRGSCRAGMQQRVVYLARARVRARDSADDEAFASVDARTRGDLEDLILRVWQELGTYARGIGVIPSGASSSGGPLPTRRRRLLRRPRAGYPAAMVDATPASNSGASSR